MMELIYFLIVSVLAASLHSVNSSEVKMENFPEYSNKEEVKAVADSQNKFTRDLYLALSNSGDGNLFFSPFSIATALAMVYIGSKGNTESQIQSVTHLPSDKSSLRKAFFDLVKDFKKDATNYELRTSNMAYVSNKLSLLDDFASALTNDFLSTCESVDFNESESVRKVINDAVDKETKSKIKDLVPSGVLNSLTRMVLVNAIYFKGLWVHKFDPSNTKPAPFWVTADKSVDVPMMTVEKDFRIALKNDLDARLLALDYQGGRMSLLILLPNQRDGLAALEQKLASVDLRTLDQRTATSKVSVSLPKFKLEEKLDLVPVLKKMGMSDLFDESSADLSAIDGSKKLFVSNVLHKAFLEVNEEGAEAAAATAVIMNRMSLIRPPRPFEVDHPFLFFLKDRHSNVILFAGRFNQP